MKHFTLEEKFNLIKEACATYDSVCCCGHDNDLCSVGIHNFGLLHFIAEKLDMKHNSGAFLSSISARITKIMRQLMAADYPVKEYKIKCCSWSEKETWHPVFVIEEKENEA